VKKIPFLKLILLLIFVFLALLCTFSYLKHGVTIDGEVAQLIYNVPPAQSYPDSDIITLLDESIVEVWEDGRCRETLHAVFKIITDKGRNYCNFESGYTPRTNTESVIYARTITPEGKIIPLNKNAVKLVTPYGSYPSHRDYKKLTFSMPGVTVGSIVDYKTVKEEKKPDLEKTFSFDHFFQRDNPTMLGRLKVIVPEDMGLKYLILNPLQGIQLSPNIIHDGNKKIYLWEYRNIPQIIKEESMPPMDEVTFRILVTRMNSWEEVSDWWRKKIAEKTESDEAIKRKVADLTKGLSTSNEKTEAISNYVKAEIRYFSPRFGGSELANAKNVFENKYGDCKNQSTLLISMLRVAGIPAYYVFMPTSHTGPLVRDFPDAGQFNHVIVAVENAGEYRFIDPVAKSYQLDYLPNVDQNRDVVILEDEKIIFTKTPLAKPEENAHYSQSQIQIGWDGSIECEVKDSGLGEEEAALRLPFINKKQWDHLRERIEKISSGAKLLAYTNSDPMNFREGFGLTFKYKTQDYCKKTGDILIFDVPEIRKSCPGIVQKDRRYPIVVSNNSYSKDEVEFNVPEGYEIYHLPEPMEIKNQYFEFCSSYRKEGERIIYEGELIRKATRITPEEYASYQKYCQGMEKSFNRSVLFRKKN
jgi:hypothetical protein